jgi:hypothetical protein
MKPRNFIAVLLPPALVWVGLGPEAVVALLIGFPAHLARVWPQITWNPDLLLPSGVAFALAVCIGHLLLRGPMQRRGVRWRANHTVCVASFIPLLFATSFLVPGMLLHARLLAEALDLTFWL